MKSGELKITLPRKDLERLRDGGRITVDVERPPQEIEVTRGNLDADGMPIRIAPESDKNGFRKHKPCADCGEFARRHSSFSCKAKTFKGEAYMLFAMSHTCDVWKPKMKIIGGRKNEAKSA